jgi:hypothetical protein
MVFLVTRISRIATDYSVYPSEACDVTATQNPCPPFPLIIENASLCGDFQLLSISLRPYRDSGQDRSICQG